MSLENPGDHYSRVATPPDSTSYEFVTSPPSLCHYTSPSHSLPARPSPQHPWIPFSRCQDHRGDALVWSCVQFIDKTFDTQPIRKMCFKSIKRGCFFMIAEDCVVWESILYIRLFFFPTEIFPRSWHPQDYRGGALVRSDVQWEALLRTGQPSILRTIAVFTDIVTFCDDLMITLLESSTIPNRHLQTGDTGDGSTTSARTCNILIRHWGILRPTAKTVRAGGIRWLSWVQRIDGLRFSNSRSYFLVIKLWF